MFQTATSLFATILIAGILSGCAVNPPAVKAPDNTWVQVGPKDWVFNQDGSTLSAALRAGTLLFQLSLACPPKGRVSHFTIGWAAGDANSYAGNSCIDERITVDVRTFDGLWFYDDLPPALKAAYARTKQERKLRR